jgi:hypothetical protein
VWGHRPVPGESRAIGVSPRRRARWRRVRLPGHVARRLEQLLTSGTSPSAPTADCDSGSCTTSVTMPARYPGRFWRSGCAEARTPSPAPTRLPGRATTTRPFRWTSLWRRSTRWCRWMLTPALSRLCCLRSGWSAPTTTRCMERWGASVQNGAYTFRRQDTALPFLAGSGWGLWSQQGDQFVMACTVRAARPAPAHGRRRRRRLQRVRRRDRRAHPMYHERHRISQWDKADRGADAHPGSPMRVWNVGGVASESRTWSGGADRQFGEGRLSRDPARDFGFGASTYGRTGADMCRLSKARVGRRTASSGSCVDWERQIRRDR